MTPAAHALRIAASARLLCVPDTMPPSERVALAEELGRLGAEDYAIRQWAEGLRRTEQGWARAFDPAHPLYETEAWRLGRVLLLAVQDVPYTRPFEGQCSTHPATTLRDGGDCFQKTSLLLAGAAILGIRGRGFWLEYPPPVPFNHILGQLWLARRAGEAPQWQYADGTVKHAALGEHTDAAVARIQRQGAFAVHPAAGRWAPPEPVRPRSALRSNPLARR